MGKIDAVEEERSYAKKCAGLHAQYLSVELDPNTFPWPELASESLK